MYFSIPGSSVGCCTILWELPSGMCSVCGVGMWQGQAQSSRSLSLLFGCFLSCSQFCCCFLSAFCKWNIFFLEVSCCKDFLKFMGLGFWEIKRGALNSHQLLMFAKKQEATLYVMTWKTFPFIANLVWFPANHSFIWLLFQLWFHPFTIKHQDSAGAHAQRAFIKQWWWCILTSHFFYHVFSNIYIPNPRLLESSDSEEGLLLHLNVKK